MTDKDLLAIIETAIEDIKDGDLIYEQAVDRAIPKRERSKAERARHSIDT